MATLSSPFRASDWLLPTVLSTTAGAVDVIGFLALGGLFTAHITGNVVIVAAHYVTGGFSQIGPLLAVSGLVAGFWAVGRGGGGGPTGWWVAPRALVVFSRG